MINPDAVFNDGTPIDWRGLQTTPQGSFAARVVLPPNTQKEL